LDQDDLGQAEFLLRLSGFLGVLAGQGLPEPARARPSRPPRQVAGFPAGSHKKEFRA